MNDDICPIFKAKKPGFCLKGNCKYWIDRCNYDEVRTAIYQKLIEARLKRHPGPGQKPVQKVK